MPYPSHSWRDAEPGNYSEKDSSECSFEGRGGHCKTAEVVARISRVIGSSSPGDYSQSSEFGGSCSRSNSRETVADYATTARGHNMVQGEFIILEKRNSAELRTKEEKLDCNANTPLLNDGEMDKVFPHTWKSSHIHNQSVTLVNGYQEK